jgi:membrane protein implicated in regulation of membrane protease activity
VLAAAVAARLVRRWWTVTPEHDVDDERYVLQGHLARVTKPIDVGVEGEVTFEFANDHRVVRARGLDERALAIGTDVVIERIEDDLAYVEAWAEVEKRL